MTCSCGREMTLKEAIHHPSAGITREEWVCRDCKIKIYIPEGSGHDEKV